MLSFDGWGSMQEVGWVEVRNLTKPENGRRILSQECVISVEDKNATVGNLQADTESFIPKSEIDWGEVNKIDRPYVNYGPEQLEC